MSEESKGLLYIATGERHIKEALFSAVASRPFAGELPIYCVTDQVDEARSSAVFDKVFPHSDPVKSYRDKIAGMAVLPFKRTLFLDSDACLTAPVHPLFQVAEPSDLAAVHAPVRIPPGWCDETVPSLFAEINSGVLLWRRSRKQKDLIQHWLNLYDELLSSYRQTWDQASLRSVLWFFVQQRRFRLAVMPAEANFRTTKPWVAGQGLSVHVLHGRIPTDEREALLHFLNGHVNRFRTWAEWHQRYPDTKLRLRIGDISPDPGSV